MSEAEPFRRHDWVWLGPEPGLPDLAEIRDHWEAGLPFIVGHNPPSMERDRLHLGLALPDKRRMGFSGAVSGIVRHRPPLSLEEVLPRVPQGWLPALEHLAILLKGAGLEVGVYGSAAWQALTGASYVRETSDLDLLLAPCTGDQLRAALAILGSMEGGRPRLDGEIVLPDGRAVAWREAARASSTLLVKTRREVALVPRAAWLSAFWEPAHA